MNEENPLPRTATTKQKVLRIAKFIVVCIVVYGIFRAVRKSWDQLVAYDFQLTVTDAAWVSLSGLLYILGMFPIGYYWYRVLWAMGEKPAFWVTMRAYFLGHLGKYVPGKAMVIVLRTGALQNHTNATVTAISVFAETLSMMAVGAFLAAALIALQFAEQEFLLAASTVMMLAAGVPTFPPVFRFIVLTLKVDRVDESVKAALNQYTWRLVVSGWVSSFVGWLIVALSLWAVLQVFDDTAQTVRLFEIYPRLLAAVSLAVVAGFLSLLPGGVGVRELVFNELLVKPLGPAVALVCPVLLRLTWLAAEFLAAGLLQLFRQRKEYRQEKTEGR